MFLKRKEQEEAFSHGIKTSQHLFSVLWTRAHEWSSPVATPSVFQPVAQIIHQIHEAHDYQWHYKTPLVLLCWSSAEKTAVAPWQINQEVGCCQACWLYTEASMQSKSWLFFFFFCQPDTITHFHSFWSLWYIKWIKLASETFSPAAVSQTCLMSSN